MLYSVIQNYPEVAQYVVGQTALEMVQEPGYPTDSNKSNAILTTLRNFSLGALAVGLGIVFLYSVLIQTVRTSSDLQKLTSLPYLGSLPFVEKKKRRRSKNAGINLMDSNSDIHYKEAMSIIIARIERHLGNHKSHVIMVTSSLPGEGKTTVSINLAIALAQTGKKAQLVDCDLRNPPGKP